MLTTTPWCFHSNTLPLFLAITMLCFNIVYLCYVDTRSSYLRLEGYSPEFVAYNVCVDNTTIHSVSPTREPPQSYLFVRRCCGCRVSEASVKEIKLWTAEWENRQRHTHYFIDIVACQCIPCAFETFPHHQYLRELRH